MSAIYRPEQLLSFHEQEFGYLQLEEQDHVFTITLNRPEQKNALNGIMVRELSYALHYAQYRKEIRVVILQANGNVFCAGADMDTFATEAEVHSSIPLPHEEVLVGELFNRLHKPSIAKVEGHVYAAGFLLLAGCTYVVACNDIKLGLPEVKRGLFPFQVMASLMEVMPARKVMDWCIRGYNLGVEQAHEWGLITHPTIQESIEEEIEKLVGQILENSPTAIRLGLQAYNHIRQTSTHELHHYLRDMLLRSLNTKDAREGMAALRDDRPPEWTGE